MAKRIGRCDICGEKCPKCMAAADKGKAPTGKGKDMAIIVAVGSPKGKGGKGK